MRMLLLTLLVACATEPVEPVYTCTLIYSCGPTLNYSEIEVPGTYEEVKEFAADWRMSCQTLTDPLVSSQKCPFTICGVLCSVDSDSESD